jgi:hypothetical protein
MSARSHLLLIILCLLPCGIYAKPGAPAAPDFCSTLLKALKAAETGPEGLKTLNADVAETGKYFRDYSHDGSVFNSSLQIGGALQTSVAKSGDYYYMHIVMEDLEPGSDIKAKYMEWRAAVSECIKSAGRPLKGYQGGVVNYYYESGDAVVQVEYKENWARTDHSLVTIDIYNTVPAFHYYRTPTNEALHADVDVATGAKTSAYASPNGKATGSRAQPAKEETHLFFTTCRNVQTLCKITADMNRHKFDEVEAKANSHLNGRSCGAPRYIGKESDVKVPGTAGRDYQVTEAVIMDF